MKVIIDFLNTLSYVTIIPVGRLITILSRISHYDEVNLTGLTKYLPFSGLIIGLILVMINSALINLSCDGYLKGLILTVAWLFLTGGLHYDGLMDTCDGIASHKDIEKTLIIMKDSRVGNFGVLAGLIVFSFKFIGIAHLTDKMTVISLVILPILGRLTEVYAIGRYKYLRTTGSGKIWHDTSNFYVDFALGLILLAIIATLLSRIYNVNLFYLIISQVIVGILITRYFVYKLGGHTGDTYGASVELSECISLIFINLFFNF